MMEPGAVVEVMGGSAALHASVRGIADLRAEIARGLRLAALHKTAEHVFPDPAARKRFVHRIVPEGSYKRRVKTGQLTPAESERTARVANVVALAEYVWEDPEAAREFLTTPHPELGDRPPIEVAVEEFGARHVEEILSGILHGIPA
jgi:putative toxin-antitoxin system antitoxin component (TIGR02293 family)